MIEDRLVPIQTEEIQDFHRGTSFSPVLSVDVSCTSSFYFLAVVCTQDSWSCAFLTSFFWGVSCTTVVVLMMSG